MCNINRKFLLFEKGRVSNYWCEKYGLSSNCEIIAFSGDNPCSLIGLGLNKPGDV